MQHIRLPQTFEYSSSVSLGNHFFNLNFLVILCLFFVLPTEVKLIIELFRKFHILNHFAFLLHLSDQQCLKIAVH